MKYSSIFSFLGYTKTGLKGLSSEIDFAESGINQKYLLKGEAPKFSTFLPIPSHVRGS
jgi:hypothetical protein